MPLLDSHQAIGAVSDLLDAQLTATTGVSTVDIGRPEEASLSSGPKFNLFLYQIDIDGHMRNQPLDRGQRPGLWLVLHYLITAFDDESESDTSDAHSLLGEGMIALQQLNFLRPSNSALVDNPEPLKITFDTADSDLLSKLMQGTDEKYRLSAAFQVRPVLIAPSSTPRYSLPVLTVGPPGAEGVAVIPSLGSRLSSVVPDAFIAGTQLTVRGNDVNGSVTEMRMGGESFPIDSFAEGLVRSTVPAATTLSAGQYLMCLVRDLGAGRELTSDTLVVKLLPDVQTASPSGLTAIPAGVHGDLDITGEKLGGIDDTIYVSFYRDGEIALMLEATGTAAQTSLSLTVSIDDAIPAGNYFIIVRVNQAQATLAPQVSWS